MVELLVGSGAGIYVPCEEGITWSTERKGSPGQLLAQVCRLSKTVAASVPPVKKHAPQVRYTGNCPRRTGRGILMRKSALNI